MGTLTKDEQISSIIVNISKELGVPVAMVPDDSEKGKLLPRCDINCTISRYLALLVYMGLNVPNNIAPPYNRVHADIEYWRKRFEGG